MTSKQHSNPNLVPTVVTDKNGRRTTVHRKAASASPSGTASIPPASLPKVSVEAQYVAGLDSLTNSGTGIGHRLYLTMQRATINKKTKIEMMEGLHEDTLAILNRPELRDAVDSIQHHLIDSCITQKTLIPLNNAAVVADVLKECDEPHRNVFHTYVDGLQMYRYQTAPLNDWSNVDAAEHEIPKALIRAAIGLKKPYSQVNAWIDTKPRHINSEGLTELIMKRPQDVQRIVDLVNQRDLPVDTEQDIINLEGLLDQDTENPLISGLL
jgi:hypothetical protein